MPGTRWLAAWGLGSVALGGASLVAPLYVVALGATPVQLGLLAAAAAFLGAPGALLVGRVADRTGHRRGIVVAALAAIGAALVAVPALSSVVPVIVANAVVWVGAAAAGPVLNLLAVVDAPDGEWSARIALLNRYGGWGWTGGLVLGAAWTGLGTGVAGITTLSAQRSFLVACAACAFGGAAGAAVWLPPGGGSAVDRRQLGRAIRAARRFNVRGATAPFAPTRLVSAARRTDPAGRLGPAGWLDPARLLARFTPALVGYFAGVALFFGGFGAFFAPLPLFLVAVGVGDGAIFGLYLVASVGSAAFYVAAGRLADRYGAALVQVAGLLVRAVAIPAVALAGGFVAASLAGLVGAAGLFLAIGVVWAVVVVTATILVTRLAPAGVRGEALGAYGALASLAGGAGSLLGGRLAAADYLLAFGAAGGLVFAGAAVVLWIRRRTGVRATAPASSGGPGEDAPAPSDVRSPPPE